jgi:hypothetical protein
MVFAVGICLAPLPAAEAATVDGIVISVNNTDKTITIQAQNGQRLTLAATIKSYLMIDQRLTVLTDFRPEMQVTVTYSGNEIATLEGYSTTNPGYVQPSSVTRTGTVTAIDRDSVRVRDASGLELVYALAPVTIVAKAGRTVSVAEINVGDRVIMTFSEIDGMIPDTIRIEGYSGIVATLYRGRMQSVDAMGSTVSLQYIEKFENGKWNKVAGVKMLSPQSGGEVTILRGGVPVLAKNLKLFRGSNVYAIVRNSFGAERYERLVLQQQYESVYTDRISSIDYYADALELANGRNVRYDEGTVFIMNGRVVDASAIASGLDAAVITYGSGQSQTAAIVQIINQSINDNSAGLYGLYAGFFQLIFPDRVEMKNFFYLDGNAWTSFSGTKTLYYDNETYIFDLDRRLGTVLSPGILSAADFFAGNYMHRADDPSFAGNRFAYVFADGDRMEGVILYRQADTLPTMRVTAGIARTDKNLSDFADGTSGAAITADSPVRYDETARIVLTVGDAADFSTITGKWKASQGTLNVGLTGTMVIVDGRALPLTGKDEIDIFALKQSIRENDRLYLMRSDFATRVLIVKSYDRNQKGSQMNGGLQ